MDWQQVDNNFSSRIVWKNGIKLLVIGERVLFPARVVLVQHGCFPGLFTQKFVISY